MADNLILLPPPEPEAPKQPNPSVVALAERILELAKEGGIDALAVVYLTPDAGLGTGFQNVEHNVPAMLGGADILKSRMTFHHVEFE